MSQSKRIPRVVSPSRKLARRFRHLPVITWAEVGRPWPRGGESLLDGPRQNEQLRLGLAERLLAGEGDPREPSAYPRFSKRDLQRAKLVVATVAPHLAQRIELAIEFNQPRRREPGHPRDPMTDRIVLAYELLMSCHQRSSARVIQGILAKMGKHITEKSVERTYRRRNANRAVRLANGFLIEVPRNDLHRVLLWRLQSLLSSPQSTAATSAEVINQSPA